MSTGVSGPSTSSSRLSMRPSVADLGAAAASDDHSLKEVNKFEFAQGPYLPRLPLHLPLAPPAGMVLARPGGGVMSHKEEKEMLRKGKWTPEEEEFVTRVISHYNAGLLNLPDGQTLRSYISKKLRCDPMRVTKKFTGACCIGKRVYSNSSGKRQITQEDMAAAQKELDELEARFWSTLEQTDDGYRPADLLKRSGMLNDPNFLHTYQKHLAPLGLPPFFSPHHLAPGGGVMPPMAEYDHAKTMALYKSLGIPPPPPSYLDTGAVMGLAGRGGGNVRGNGGASSKQLNMAHALGGGPSAYATHSALLAAGVLKPDQVLATLLNTSNLPPPIPSFAQQNSMIPPPLPSFTGLHSLGGLPSKYPLQVPHLSIQPLPQAGTSSSVSTGPSPTAASSPSSSCMTNTTTTAPQPPPSSTITRRSPSPSIHTQQQPSTATAAVQAGATGVVKGPPPNTPPKWTVPEPIEQGESSTDLNASSEEAAMGSGGKGAEVVVRGRGRPSRAASAALKNNSSNVSKSVRGGSRETYDNYQQVYQGRSGGRRGQQQQPAYMQAQTGGRATSNRARGANNKNGGLEAETASNTVHTHIVERPRSATMNDFDLDSEAEAIALIALGSMHASQQGFPDDMGALDGGVDSNGNRTTAGAADYGQGVGGGAGEGMMQFGNGPLESISLRQFQAFLAQATGGTSHAQHGHQQGSGAGAGPMGLSSFYGSLPLDLNFTGLFSSSAFWPTSPRPASTKAGGMSSGGVDGDMGGTGSTPAQADGTSHEEAAAVTSERDASALQRSPQQQAPAPPAPLTTAQAQALYGGLVPTALPQDDATMGDSMQDDGSINHDPVFAFGNDSRQGLLLPDLADLISQEHMSELPASLRVHKRARSFGSGMPNMGGNTLSVSVGGNTGMSREPSTSVGTSTGNADDLMFPGGLGSLRPEQAASFGNLNNFPLDFMSSLTSPTNLGSADRERKRMRL